MHLDLCRLMVYMSNYVLPSRWDKIERNQFSAPCYKSCYNFYVLASYGPILAGGIAMGLPIDKRPMLWMDKIGPLQTEIWRWPSRATRLLPHVSLGWKDLLVTPSPDVSILCIGGHRVYSKTRKQQCICQFYLSVLVHVVLGEYFNQKSGNGSYCVNLYNGPVQAVARD